MSKDRLLQIRVDDGFMAKLEYLKEIYGFRTIAETLRFIVNKEFRKEQADNGKNIQTR